MVSINKQPLFSILLPTHNRADVVGYAINSILSQTIGNYEVLIAGDGCTDNTEEIVRGFINADERIKWFPFKKGKGFGYVHRNTVLRNAKGKYIAFVAHDDLWFPDHLEFLLNFFKKNRNHSIVYSRPLWIHPDGTIIPSVFNTNHSKTREIFLHKHNEIPAGSVIHTRASAQKAGFINHGLIKDADWDLWKKIIYQDKNRGIGFIPVPTTIHFKAIWRKKGNYWNDSTQALYRKIKTTPDLNKILMIKLKKQHPPQKTVWEKYLKNPAAVKQIRENVITGIDALGYDFINTRIEYKRLAFELGRIKNTKGYILLEQLRKIRKFKELF